MDDFENYDDYNDYRDNEDREDDNYGDNYQDDNYGEFNDNIENDDEQPMTSTFRDTERTSIISNKGIDIGQDERLDPQKRAEIEYKNHYKNLSNDEQKLEISLKIIKSIPSLQNYNQSLLALAGKFFSDNSDKHSVNRKNITEFIERYGKNYDAADIIRYIKFYERMAEGIKL